MLLIAVAAPLSGGLVLETAKHLLLLKAGGSWVNALVWTTALLGWWLILALLWLNRSRFEIVDLRDGTPIRSSIAIIPLLAALIVMASGLGLISAVGTVARQVP